MRETVGVTIVPVVARTVPSPGEGGHTFCAVVAMGAPGAGRFLPPWPKTCGARCPLQLTFGAPPLWLCGLHRAWRTQEEYHHGLPPWSGALTLCNTQAFCWPCHEVRDAAGISVTSGCFAVHFAGLFGLLDWEPLRSACGPPFVVVLSRNW